MCPYKLFPTYDNVIDLSNHQQSACYGNGWHHVAVFFNCRWRSRLSLVEPFRVHSQITANQSMVCAATSRVHATATIDIPWISTSHSITCQGLGWAWCNRLRSIPSLKHTWAWCVKQSAKYMLGQWFTSRSCFLLQLQVKVSANLDVTV